MQSQLTDHVLRFGGNLNVRHFPHPHVLDLPCQPDTLRMNCMESSNKLLTFSILFPLSNKRERATTTGHPRLGIFVDISQAAPGRTTTVDPAAGASARRREGQGSTPSPVSTALLRRSHCSPRSYSLAASLSQSPVFTSELFAISQSMS